jgi:hypothetical protein
MGQQPNVYVSPAARPRPTAEPGPARRWRPTRPGVITAPGEMPWGGAFGTPGPDTGYALRLIAEEDLPHRSPLLEQVLAAIMSARASLSGRAPTREDLQVASLIVGLDDGDEALIERRQRWLEKAAREKVPGREAVAAIDPQLLRSPPEQVRRERRVLGR